MIADIDKDGRCVQQQPGSKRAAEVSVLDHPAVCLLQTAVGPSHEQHPGYCSTSSCTNILC